MAMRQVLRFLGHIKHLDASLTTEMRVLPVLVITVSNLLPIYSKPVLELRDHRT